MAISPFGGPKMVAPKGLLVIGRVKNTPILPAGAIILYPFGPWTVERKFLR